MDTGVRWQDYEFTPKPAPFQPLDSGTVFVRQRSNPWSLLVLAGLQSRPMYEGTAPRNRVRSNRQANKLARKSRRRNRGRK